jgi:replication-associated recombination protein RarA
MKTLVKRKLLGFLNDLQDHKKIGNIDSTNGPTSFDSIRQKMSNLVARYRYIERQKTQIFGHVIGYDGIKRTFLRSLNSEEPVHILLVGSPGQAKTMFLKSILETFGEKKAFFTVGGNASKSGLIDVLFDLRPKYLLTDEIEHLRSEYQTILLSLMETNTNSDYAQ